jgi:hypothetical protein
LMGRLTSAWVSSIQNIAAAAAPILIGPLMMTDDFISSTVAPMKLQ